MPLHRDDATSSGAPRPAKPFFQRQVSWLAGHRHVPAFPVIPIEGFQWRLGKWLAAYSCGGSRGIEPETGSHRILS